MSELTMNETREKLENRHRLGKPVQYPDPDNPGEMLTFVIVKIGPGTSLLLNDIAIITSVLLSADKKNESDTLEKAIAEGRGAEKIQQMQDIRTYENRILARGLIGYTEADADELLVDNKLRQSLIADIQKGAMPTAADSTADVDTFSEGDAVKPRTPRKPNSKQKA